MKSLIGAAIAGAILFATSAGVSWYLVKQSEPETDETAAQELVDADATSAFPKPIGDGDKTEVMPVALRPNEPVTVEAVTKLAKSIMEKEQAVFDRQQFLRKEEQRINLLFEDLKRERDELTAFGEKIDAKILLARETVEVIKQENQALINQTKALESLEKETGRSNVDVEAADLLRRVAIVKDWFKNLEPEQAALYLKEVANGGELEFAARLLDSQEDRIKGKILQALNDPALFVQIIDAYTKKKTDDTKIQEP